MHSRVFQKGMTLLEILIVISIGAFLITTSFSSFFSLSKREVLRGEAFQVLSVITRARSQTLASKNDTQYGVHLATSSITMFSGSAYVANNSGNIVIKLNSAVSIATTTLSGSGSDIIFNRLSGTTSQYGTTTISLVKDTAQYKMIVIYSTGIAEIK